MEELQVLKKVFKVFRIIGKVFKYLFFTIWLGVTVLLYFNNVNLSNQVQLLEDHDSKLVDVLNNHADVINTLSARDKVLAKAITSLYNMIQSQNPSQENNSYVTSR